MKKSFKFPAFSLAMAMVVSCGHTRPQYQKTSATQELDTRALSDTVEMAYASPKSGAENHELVDADADDQQIKAIVGANEIDEELPGAEVERAPYSSNFLKQKNTKRMQFWVEFFTKRERERFQRFINNGEEYRHHIEKIFSSYGLPKELYFVGLIESGYYLGARSHASAVGPWQFIKGTGKRYGLKITSEIDERRDLFKASEAAAKYFKDLHNVFSSWELALAAYNSGENGVVRRIMKYGTRDYYELSRRKALHSETINYVPKVLAAMHVWNNAQKYGFHIPKKKHRIFDLTELRPMPKNTSLKTLAKRLKVDYQLLKKLNPDLNRGKTPRYYSGTFKLRVPTNSYAYHLPEQTQRGIATGKKRITSPSSRKEVIRRTAKSIPKYHRVRRGETLISVSRKYGLTPKAIAQANGFKTWRTKIRIGQKLALTTNSKRSNVKVTNKPIIYQVRPGDNLTEIAGLFNRPIKKIKKANKLKRSKILVGQKIVIPNTQKGIYTVKRGDHLTKVARKFNQPLDALIKLNALKRKTIYPGQKLIVNMD